MTRLPFVVIGAIAAACLGVAALRLPARAADDACATPACAIPDTPASTSLASALVVPGARRAASGAAHDIPQEWIADLRHRVYYDASCAAAAELDADTTLRMRFERTLVDLGYRRSDAPGC